MGPGENEITSAALKIKLEYIFIRNNLRVGRSPLGLPWDIIHPLENREQVHIDLKESFVCRGEPHSSPS